MVAGARTLGRPRRALPIGDTGPAQPAPRSPIQPRVLTLLLAGLTAIVVAGNNAGTLAQPALAEAFGAGPADVAWVVFGYSSTFAISNAVWGVLARRFGIGPCLSVGTLMIATGCVLAVVAPTLIGVIGARMLQGLGSGAIPTLGTAALAHRFVGHDRSRALGVNIAGVAVGLAAGPLIGGLALDLFGARGPLAFGIVVAPAAFVFWRIDREREPGFPIDLVGAALVATAILGLVYSLNRLPLAGLVPATFVAVAAVAVSLPLLVRRTARPGAFVPGRIVRNRDFLRLAPLAGLGQMTFMASMVLVPVAGARAYGLAGLELGLMVLPMALVTAAASLSNARVQRRIGRRATTVVSLVSLGSGSALLGLFGVTAGPLVLSLLLTPMGLGFGLLNAPLLNELTEAFSGADRAAAVGLSNLSFFLGGAIGAATSTAIVQAGLELAPFAARPVAGYSSVELVFALAPLGVAFLLRRGRRDRTPPRELAIPPA